MEQKSVIDIYGNLVVGGVRKRCPRNRLYSLKGLIMGRTMERYCGSWCALFQERRHEAREADDYIGARPAYHDVKLTCGHGDPITIDRDERVKG